MLTQLLPMKEAVQVAWDARCFALGGNFAPNDRLNVELLTSTIQSGRWWALSHMMHALNSWADGVASWCEGCQCHYWLHGFHEAGRPVANNAHVRFAQALAALPIQASDGATFACPLRGRRAVELACGRFLRKSSRA